MLDICILDLVNMYYAYTPHHAGSIAYRRFELVFQRAD